MFTESSIFCFPTNLGEQRAAVRSGRAYQNVPVLFSASVRPQAAGRPENENVLFLPPGELKIIQGGVDWEVVDGRMGVIWG